MLVSPDSWNTPVPRLTLLLFANFAVAKFVEPLKAVFPIERRFAQFVKSSFVSFELRNESFPIVCKAEFSGKTSSLMFDPQKALLLIVVRLAGKVNVSGVSAFCATSVKALFWIVVKASHALKSSDLMFAPRKASWSIVVSFLHALRSTVSIVVFWKAPRPIVVMFGSWVKSTFCNPVQPLKA